MSQKGLRPQPAMVLAVALLAGCGATLGGSDPDAVTRGAFKADYMSARASLERGRFGRAAKGYEALLEQAGPAAPRIRLEYAHALLRADKFEAASRTARKAASEQEGLARASALSVQATADHEIARAGLAEGRADADLHARLVSAREAFDAILQDHPELDPMGGLAARRDEAARAEEQLSRRLGQ